MKSGRYRAVLTHIRPPTSHPRRPNRPARRTQINRLNRARPSGLASYSGSMHSW
jgi:hypothetical protein